MIQCPACEQPAVELKSSPALCPPCYQDAMNQLTKIWAEGGANQERRRISEALRSLKNVRRPLWIEHTTEPLAKQAWDQAVDSALGLAEQAI